jgi:hypothetical protein
MMRIRREQMEAMSQAVEEQFTRETVCHLATSFATYLERNGIPEDSLFELVEAGTADAKRYGLFYPGHIRKYLEIVVMTGPGLGEGGKFAWIPELLEADGPDGETKLQRINERLLFEWEDIA